MLRITSQNDPAGACRYFDPQGHDYYLDGEELAGYWGGKGATLHGLHGEVDRTDFEALAYNRYPESYRPDRNTKDKITVLDNANRRVGYDFSFSVPKSVTLAFELTGDQRILDAVKRSVADTMEDIERDALVRDQRNGKVEYISPGNLTHATFIHRSSRPINGVPDCQLHAHVFVFNMAKYDGRWTAVELGEVKANAPYYEALAMARLGKSLVDMGYGVRRKGKFFELEGVSNELVEKFSNRKRLIEAVAEAKGVTNPVYKAELGGKTREHKSESHHSPAELRQIWLSRLTDSERESLENLPAQTKPLPSVEQSVRFALDHSFERSAIVGTKKVLEHGLRHGVGRVTLDELLREVDRAGLLTKGDESTTREMLALEAGMIRWARDGVGASKPIAPQHEPRDYFGKDQKAGIRHVLGSHDRVITVRGAAGVGKTEAMIDVVTEARKVVPVQAVAIGSKAVEVLGKEVDPNAATVARFLIDADMQDRLRGGLLLVDEAGQVGTKDAAKLFSILERIDARMCLVGDLAQHGSVAAGSPFRLVQDYAGLGAVAITEVRRQTGAYKRVSEYLSEHKTDKALDLLEQMGHVHECDYTERNRLIVNDYLDAVRGKQTVLVVAPTHAEGESVTHHIREALKREGRIKDDERDFTRLVPLNLTEAERCDVAAGEGGSVAQFVRATGGHKAGDRVRLSELDDRARAAASIAVYREDRIHLATGDAIRVTANGKDKSGKHKLKNGAVYTVKGFDRDGGIKLNNGWVLPKDFGFLTHGYVSTSHASQGRTVDVVLVSESSNSFPAASAEQLYVSISRGKKAAYIYTDRLDELRERVRQARPQKLAHDLVADKPNPVRDRNRFLGRVKSVANQAVEQVRRLTQEITKPKERNYEYELG